ncbi:nucleotidyltransferase [Burkholderia sp.]|uniref:nucleotidyltransferase domain-containing protein n=1 Tax=Burkholderia sp. TaxID=36773 RepID=UPI00258CFC82|nr:nucleotidyltransferase [Burkholderia sp.]MCA3799989.1 nucleotidyltransferase [Burkholderia sp.]
MNEIARFANKLVHMDPVDVLLADVAVRIQLSPTDHAKAESRYGTVAAWIDRHDSPLHGRVGLVYPQGSMAIGATVARYSERDEYDIDLMAQIDIWRGATPKSVLDTLHDAIRGDRGSRYWGKTERRTRCVTIFYEDGMHLDVTPAERRGITPERESDIFHSKPEDPAEPEMRVVANPFGFGDWFKGRTPADDAFGLYFEKRSLDEARLQALAKADADPVPEQVPAYRKSKAVIALQLLKRWRNILYDRRQGQRRPPSILMSWSIASHANRTETLFEELVWQAEALRTILQEADRLSSLVHVENPICQADVFTDRWPKSRADQQKFIEDLTAFLRDMAILRRAETPSEMLPILERLFGERPAREAVRGYFERAGAAATSGSGLVLPKTGRIPVAVTGLSVAPGIARSSPKHTFFGA